MNTYKITATRSDGTEVSDRFTEATEGAARKAFKECYRHDTYTINSIELVAENAPASKQQERDALEKIRKIVDTLGPDSYLATAFAGCFQDAEDNIENDFAFSMSARWQHAEEQLKQKEAEIESLKAENARQAKNHEDDARRFAEQKQDEIAALKAEIAAIQRPVETSEISDELLADLATFSLPYVDRIRTAIISNAGQIAKDATLVQLLHEYTTREAQERTEYAREVYDSIKRGTEFRPFNNCLTHASSYRQVIDDLLRHYWD
ncbi:hypothetical protein [Gemmiger formicilis]